MTTLEPQIATRLSSGDEAMTLASQWRRLARAATAVAVLTSPALLLWFHNQVGWSLVWSLIATFLAVIAFRGFVDIVIRRLIPWPSLFGTADQRFREEDVVNRRRAWYWRRRYGLAAWIVGLITAIWLLENILGKSRSWLDTVHGMTSFLSNPQVYQNIVILPLFFLINFAILFGPMALMGISQMKAFEPGDADWGVRLEDVRGQAEAKEEVRRVVSLWQSGEAFEQAGGRRERGLLFLGPPGTGKTMLSKAIATGFNCPFVSMPGSGFAQTFMGMDVVIVRYLAFKAKRLANKWGGQCIVFIDEIDAVGMRRQAIQQMAPATDPYSWRDVSDFSFYGPWGAQNPSGDLIVETRRWRDRRAGRNGPDLETARLNERRGSARTGGQNGVIQSFIV